MSGTASGFGVSACGAGADLCRPYKKSFDVFWPGGKASEGMERRR